MPVTGATSSPRGVLIATTLVLTLLIASSALTMSWWNHRAPTLVRSSRIAQADGLRFGRTTTAARCVDQVLQRFARTPPDPGVAMTERQFLQSCLAASQPATDLCLPGPGTTPPGNDWLMQFCAARNMTDRACLEILKPLAEYCTTRRNGTSAPG